jgi:N-methylhydantoinase B
MMPVFVGEAPLAIVAVMAHWQDVGGMVPGSLSGAATEIFQEGIRLPPVRVARAGRPVEEVLDILFANVRDPADRRGDLQAMEGACRLAEAKLHGLAARWGALRLGAAMATLLDRAERRMRAAISALPDGVYRAENHLDNTGPSPEPLTLKLRLVIAGDALTADFTGCPPQLAGPTNLGPAHATTAVFTMTKAFLDPRGPINAGAMRPLTVVVPEGTMLNARPPAACGAIGEVRRALEGLVMGALGRAVPTRAVGDLKGASNITTIAWRGQPPFVEFPAGGTGARADADGNNAVRNFAEGDLSSIQPVEAIELRWPLRVERCELRADSGGAGMRRGGLGLSREIRVLEPGATLSVLSDKNVIPPYGVNGASGGAPNRFFVRRGGTVVEPSRLPGKVTAFPLDPGDVVVMQSAGGGGYGDPRERDPAALERDLALGYVTAAGSAAYGAGHAPLALTVFRMATAPGPRQAVLGARTAERVGLRDGDLVEFPREGPSPRAWVRIADGIEDGAIGLDGDSIALLGIADGAAAAVRRVRLGDD